MQKKFDRLFKKTSSGKTQVWDIWVESNADGTATIYTRHGLEDGKLQETKDVIREGKNLGRKNATTPFDQAYKEAEAAWQEKMDRKHYGLTVEDSAGKRAIAPMLAQSYDKHAAKVDWHNAFVQPKLDGNRCHAVRVGDKIELITREGLLITTCPHIQNTLLSIMPDGQTWDGELYVHGTAVTKLNSLLRREQPDSVNVNFNVYDILLPAPFIDRHKELLRWITKDKGPVHKVETVRISDEKSLMTRQVEFIDEGYEGAMLRYGKAPYEAGKRSYSLLKVKTFQDAEFTVVGFKEGRGTYAGMAIFCCTTEEGHGFDVTAPGTLEEKADYWVNRQKYLGKKLTVKYAGMTDTETPVPFHPVAKAFR